jgi:hypothetical protein
MFFLLLFSNFEIWVIGLAVLLIKFEFESNEKGFIWSDGLSFSEFDGDFRCRELSMDVQEDQWEEDETLTPSELLELQFTKLPPTKCGGKIFSIVFLKRSGEQPMVNSLLIELPAATSIPGLFVVISATAQFGQYILGSHARHRVQYLKRFILGGFTGSPVRHSNFGHYVGR